MYKIILANLILSKAWASYKISKSDKQLYWRIKTIESFLLLPSVAYIIYLSLGPLELSKTISGYCFVTYTIVLLHTSIALDKYFTR